MSYNLNIYTSNRMEILAENLARIIRGPLPAPTLPEVIVVQSRGMERWVSMELARHNGICANTVFPFPNALVKEIVSQTFSMVPDESFYDPLNMTFAVMNMLPECLQLPAFESLKRYLDDDKNQLKLYQMAKKMADLFDQYLVFRPEMILQWENGEETHWQAILWRKLVPGRETRHRAGQRRELIEKLRSGSLNIDDLPGRVSIFGISYLPPFYLEVFVEMSKVMEVNFFIMNPCKEYWADIVSDREITKIQGKHDYDKVSEDTLYLDMGNRILATTGLLGKHFLSLISGQPCRSYEHFEQPGGSSMLAKIQTDILALKDRKTDIPCAQDMSLQIHSCHSPMREIEILHDNLLAMFEEMPDLLPSEIVVMAPDIASYASYVEAVFDAQQNETLRIPYTIADRSIKMDGRLIDGFLSLLDLKRSRLGAVQVLRLLEIADIRERFDIAESDVAIIEEWIKKTNIRWGKSAQHRRDLGFPAVSENTWNAGIERLLLGYAMPGENRRMFADILPYDHVEGTGAHVLGNFLAFLQQLFTCVDALDIPKTLQQWQVLLTEMVDRFFTPREETERELQALRHVIDDLSRWQRWSGFERTVDIDVVQSYVNNRLENEYLGTGFITGGVTFCAMLPMRSIPFRVVCLIGMDSNAFPRESKKLSFDLMAENPRIGDRSRRNDDKYLFLEALISARDKLYISYVGQSIQDNTTIPPSVLVSQVIDYIKDGFGIAEKNLITHHRLQAFSPAYFKDSSRLFSYSEENFSACRSLDINRLDFTLVEDALPEPAAKWRHIDIDDLRRFFNHPARFFLEKRLGVYLPDTMTLPDERENFTLDPLTAYEIGQDLTKTGLAGIDLMQCRPLQKALGRLPHGTAGDILYGNMKRDVEAFVKKIARHFAGRALEQVRVDIDIGEFRLSGRVDTVREGGYSTFQYAKIKPKYILNTWIYHLIVNMSVEGSAGVDSYLICKDGNWQFRAVAESDRLLQMLLEMFWLGMSEPLHFFPESSYTYAENVLLKGRSGESALKSAANKWAGSEFVQGESQDPYFERCFGHGEPLDESFRDIAEHIFSPMLAHGTAVTL